MHEELVKSLRQCAEASCAGCKNDLVQIGCRELLQHEAADAIEELLKVASAMHTWIFLNTGDEQKAYDECGLSDEMNAALGYSGQFVAEPPKEE
jgi:hypothetical protein